MNIALATAVPANSAFTVLVIVAIGVLFQCVCAVIILVVNVDSWRVRREILRRSNFSMNQDEDHSDRDSSSSSK